MPRRMWKRLLSHLLIKERGLALPFVSVQAPTFFPHHTFGLILSFAHEGSGLILRWTLLGRTVALIESSDQALNICSKCRKYYY